jgi:hypothetical protein
LVGLTHPDGDLVIIDLDARSVRETTGGIPWELGRMVSREILVTSTGSIFTCRGPENPDEEAVDNPVWRYDSRTRVTSPTGVATRGGFWNGQATTTDGRSIYFSTVSGELYVLDVLTETIDHLGHFRAPTDNDPDGTTSVRYLYGISLSADEDLVVGAPIVAAADALGRRVVPHLVTYAIATGTFRSHGRFDADVVTGSNHRDSDGNIYVAAFGGEHGCRLAVLTSTTKPLVPQ